MLTIRLSRIGTTKRPVHRIVVVESRAPRDGRFVESLGHYNARAEPEVLQVDYERVSYWTSKGARLSDTVRTLLARHPAPPPGAEAVAQQVKAADEPAVAVETTDEPAVADGDETQVVT